MKVKCHEGIHSNAEVVIHKHLSDWQSDPWGFGIEHNNSRVQNKWQWYKLKNHDNTNENENSKENNTENNTDNEINKINGSES